MEKELRSMGFDYIEIGVNPWCKCHYVNFRSPWGKYRARCSGMIRLYNVATEDLPVEMYSYVVSKCLAHEGILVDLTIPAEVAAKFLFVADASGIYIEPK